MSCFLSNSSLGKKLVMSVTGCFLVLFILFHMSMNIVAIISPEAYNMICALLGANWYALAGTAVLAAGVVVHFIYAVILTLENLKARGNQRYAVAPSQFTVKSIQCVAGTNDPLSVRQASSHAITQLCAQFSARCPGNTRIERRYFIFSAGAGT